MPTKKAANLKCGDIVVFDPRDRRRVKDVQVFVPDHLGATQSVRVTWETWDMDPVPYIALADQDITVE